MLRIGGGIVMLYLDIRVNIVFVCCSKVNDSELIFWNYIDEIKLFFCCVLILFFEKKICFVKWKLKIFYSIICMWLVIVVWNC